MRMNYEGLLRAAYNCGRDHTRGIDADSFNGLLRKEQAFKKSKDVKTAYEFGIKAGEILTQISLAIEQIINDERFDLSKEQQKVLKEQKLKLISPDIDSTVDTICEVIVQVKKMIK